MSWVLPYLNQRWTEKTDCYHWFARIQREVFGRDVPLVARPAYRHQWVEAGKDAATWRDGDAVIMYSVARDVRLTHIGVWHTADGGGVVHAQTGGTVCFDARANLEQQQWAIREVLHYADDTH
jgi:hypothetical protein